MKLLLLDREEVKDLGHASADQQGGVERIDHHLKEKHYGGINGDWGLVIVETGCYSPRRGREQGAVGSSTTRV